MADFTLVVKVSGSRSTIEILDSADNSIPFTSLTDEEQDLIQMKLNRVNDFLSDLRYGEGD